MKSRFLRAVVLSFALHAVFYGGFRGWMEWRRRRALEGIDVDLSHSSLLQLPPAMGGQRAYIPPEEWYVGEALKLAPRPAPVPLSQAAKVEAEPEGVAAAVGPPCPPPCPSNAGDWAPSSQSVQKPVWLDGMISEDDYPKEARYRNITGLVVVEALLDTEGKVRDVVILQGSDPLLNDKTVEKLKQARFSPCVDASGKPFPCTLRLPIDWTLE